MLSVPGIVELFVIVFVLGFAFMLRRLGGNSSAKWLLAVSVCLAAAAIFSPADLVSQIVLFIPLFAALILGSRLRLFDVPVAS